MNEKKIVLLIDAENTSAKYADGIMEYLVGKGDIISAQIYGDFIDSKNTKQWNPKAIEYNLQRYQADTTKAGKNAADIALVIDAMDFLHKEVPADIFCIVTSDGDFTSLVERIRKDSITVVGMGKKDASPRLRRACSEYVELDNNKQSGQEKEQKISAKTKDSQLADTGKKSVKEEKSKKSAKTKDVEDSAKKTAKDRDEKTKWSAKDTEEKRAVKDAGKTKKSAKIKETDTTKMENTTVSVPLKNIKMTLNELVQIDENSGKQADLGGIKSRLQLKYPGFDERDYGYQSIRELIDNETKFSVCQEGTQAYVVLDRKDQHIVELEKVCRFMLDLYPKKVIGQHEVSSLGRKLKKEFPEFDYKSYGYAKLSLFLTELGFSVY